MTLSQVELKSLTQPVQKLKDSGVNSPEDLVAYLAKVSNPSGQLDLSNRNKLLSYCIKNKHWSIFEMVDATMEIYTPRDISRQLLRHRTFTFQEFSQRYSDQITFCERGIRSQDLKNRQNSIDNISSGIKAYYKKLYKEWVSESKHAYKTALDDGVAKECARVMLPEGLTMSKLYMKGSLRSWLHYLDVREGNGTQLEHIELANLIRKELEPVFPNVMGIELNE